MRLPPIYHMSFFSNMELPTVYSDSLSYLEDVSKLYAKVNEIIKNYNVLIDYYNSLADLLAEFEQKITEINAALTALDQWKKDFEAQFAALETALNNKIDRDIAALTAQINQTVNQMFAEQNTKIQQQLDQITKMVQDNNTAIRNEVSTKLNAFLASIPNLQNVVIIDPGSGKAITLQQWVDSFYGFKDPFTGENLSMNQYVRLNNDLLRSPGALTAEEYDAKKVKAEEYDDLHLTAEQYDWQASEHLREWPKEEDET